MVVRQPGEWATQALVEELIRLWEDGVPTGEMARRLSTPECPVTKNQVIGKVHRLGLVPRVVASKPSLSFDYFNVFNFDRPAGMSPLGPPGDETFPFCGEPPLPGKPYCAEHAAIAYIRLKDPERRNRIMEVAAD